jgi:nicotinamidase-related amidase
VANLRPADGRGRPQQVLECRLPAEWLSCQTRPVGTTDRRPEDLTAPQFESSALLVIDVQADFLDGGACTIAGTSERLPRMVELVMAYRSAALPIVHAVRLYDGDDVDLVRRAAVRAGMQMVRPGSPGAQIAPQLGPNPDLTLDSGALLAGKLQKVSENEVVMWKPRWSAFYRTPLDDHLRRLGVDTVVLTGCNFPNCPRATLFDASERDYRVVVVEDATSRVTPERLADAVALGVHALPTGTVVRHVSSKLDVSDAGPERNVRGMSGTAR